MVVVPKYASAKTSFEFEYWTHEEQRAVVLEVAEDGSWIMAVSVVIVLAAACCMGLIFYRCLANRRRSNKVKVDMRASDQLGSL